jgi:hypothetical protein
MKTYQVDWQSEGNIDGGRVIVFAAFIAEAQDKFFAWLRKRPVYKHMWKLNVVFTEVDYIEPEVIQ